MNGEGMHPERRGQHGASVGWRRWAAQHGGGNAVTVTREKADQQRRKGGLTEARDHGDWHNHPDRLVMAGVCRWRGVLGSGWSWGLGRSTRMVAFGPAAASPAPRRALDRLPPPGGRSNACWWPAGALQGSGRGGGRENGDRAGVVHLELAAAFADPAAPLRRSRRDAKAGGWAGSAGVVVESTLSGDWRRSAARRHYRLCRARRSWAHRIISFACNQWRRSPPPTRGPAPGRAALRPRPASRACAASTANRLWATARTP